MAIVKEWLPEEIAAFTEKYWPSDELFLDEDKAFFSAVNNGEPLYLAMSALVNPFRSALHRKIDDCQCHAIFGANVELLSWVLNGPTICENRVDFCFWLP